MKGNSKKTPQTKEILEMNIYHLQNAYLATSMCAQHNKASLFLKALRKEQIKLKRLNARLAPICKHHKPIKLSYIAFFDWAQKQETKGLHQSLCPICQRFFYPSEMGKVKPKEIDINDITIAHKHAG